MCLLSQFSSLSIEDQEDIQFPYAMRDLPPVSQRHTLGHQASVNHEAEGTAANGRRPCSPQLCPSTSRPTRVARQRSLPAR